MADAGNIIVPNIGPSNAKLVVVGEAPGEEEERNNQPFWPTARAGEKLANCLGRNGVMREEVYLANLFKQRPAGNKFEAILSHPNLPVYVNQLREDLLKIQPNVILACGNWPLYFLTGRHGYAHGKPKPGSGIGHFRGSILPCTLKGLENTKVVPTYHPAAVAREASLYPIFDLDIKRAVFDSGFSEFNLPKRTLIINPTPGEIEQAVLRFSKAKLVSFDIEAFGSKLACVGFSDDPSYAICIPWNVSAFGDTAIVRILTSNTPKVPHFGFFDVSYLKYYYSISVENYHWDSFVAQRVMNPELPRTLEYLTSIYTREPYYKDTGHAVLEDTKSWNKDSADLNQLWIYNCKDAAVTLEIAQQQIDEISDSKNWIKTMKFDMDQTRECCLPISFNGLLVDPIRQNEIREILVKKWVKHQEDLNSLVGQATKKIETLRSITDDERMPEVPILFNANSTKQCKEVLYTKFKLRERRNRESGVTVDENALIGLIADVKKEYETKVREDAKNKWLLALIVLKKIIIVRGIRKKLSSYINIEVSHDGRARSLFKLGPETARWSAQKWIDGTGLNLQTTPRDSVEDV